MINLSDSVFGNIVGQLQFLFLNGVGHPVETRNWQGVDVTKRPEMKPYEITNVNIEVPVHPLVDRWGTIVKPNLPWAEEHFKERVGGVPLNPPPSHEIWPHAQASNEEFRQSQQFSHTYPERFWPKFANEGTKAPNGRQIFVPHLGIRFEYGDLMDVVILMHRDPYTRQAFLPVFFPEDTGAHHGERIPCTLGYLFMYRQGMMNITYYIRSCDFRRHFRDDVYMAGRLCHWMTAMLRDTDLGLNVLPGKLVMHIGSLHVFEGDLPLMNQEARVADQKKAEVLSSVW